jgi:hypothetical protein
VGYVGAAALGATATAALFLSQDPVPVLSAGTHELVSPATAGGESSEQRVPIAAIRECGAKCCGGSECAAADQVCASGRRCIPCDVAGPNQNRYRLRLGSLNRSANMSDERATSASTVCVTIGSLETQCVPAQANDDRTEPWRVLRPAVSDQDLLSGVRVEVRDGNAQTIASWAHPVVVQPDVLCRGLAVKPVTVVGATKEPYGGLSIFLDDAHYVELGRGAKVSDLVALEQGFIFEDERARIFETTSTGSDRFAVIIGPLDKAQAERLRWLVLDQGRAARLTVGSDLVGEPRPGR